MHLIRRPPVRLAAARFSALLCSAAAEIEDTFLPGGSPLIRFTGRSVVDDAGHRSFDFPGSSIGVCIRGATTVSAILHESGTNRYGVSLDGGKSWARTLNTTAGRHEYTVAALSEDETHDILVLKLTEACSRVYGCPWGDFGTATLEGLRLSPGASALPPRPPAWIVEEQPPHTSAKRPRRLEFIGDSITAGWAACAPASATDDDACNAGADVRASWAHLIARQLGAEAHVIAWGGIGLVQNDDAGTRPDGAAAPALWQRALANDPGSKWDVTAWPPDAVVIHLGTNDLCCDAPVPNATFEQAYVDFVRRIVMERRTAEGPPAAVFLGCGPMGNSKGNKDHTGREGYFPVNIIQRVAAAVNASAGLEGIAHVLDFSAIMDEADCVGGCRHPSEEAHARMAARSTERIRAVLGW